MVVRVFDRESLLWAPIYILPFRSECCESRLDFPIIMTSIPLFQALGPITGTMTSSRTFESSKTTKFDLERRFGCFHFLHIGTLQACFCMKVQSSFFSRSRRFTMPSDSDFKKNSPVCGHNKSLPSDQWSECKSKRHSTHSALSANP